MINEQFSTWLNQTFSGISYQGNPSSKKLKWNGRVFKVDDAFDIVQDAYKDAITNNKTPNTNAVLIKKGSDDANEVLSTLFAIAKANKKAHSNHESVRRAADVSGSLGDVLSKMNEAPVKPNKYDIEILSHFRLAVNDTMREVFYVDEDGSLQSVGMFSDNSRNLQSIAEAMAKRHPVDIANAYEAFERCISDSYNQLQTMNQGEIDNVLHTKGFDQWPEIRSLYSKDLESVLVAMIAHYRTNSVPALMWAMGYVNLYRVTSTRQEGETKISWTSGFKIRQSQGYIIDDVTYYKFALQVPQYFPQIENPKRFGDVYKIVNEPSGNVLHRYDDSPFLKMVFSEMTQNQICVFCAFWYCVAHRLPTPSLLVQDHGGNAKNGNVEVYKEGMAEMWGCPKAAVSFKLERDQLANKERKYHVKADGLCKRTLLDSLFVFYDEVSPSKEMWDEFKALSGANEVSINVRPMYENPYVVTNEPVPFFFTRNSFMPLYERGAMLRRLVVIRTNANNAYLNLLTDEERKMLDDPQMRKDTFATLMSYGKRAYEKIESLGGMLNINNIFEDIGSVLGSSSEDYETEMKYFYKSLFEEVAPVKDAITLTCEDIWKRFTKLYPDFDDDAKQKSMEMRLSEFLLGADIRNKKGRVCKGTKRPTCYTLYRNDVISAMADPIGEVA